MLRNTFFESFHQIFFEFSSSVRRGRCHLKFNKCSNSSSFLYVWFNLNFVVFLLLEYGLQLTNQWERRVCQKRSRGVIELCNFWMKMTSTNEAKWSLSNNIRRKFFFRCITNNRRTTSLPLLSVIFQIWLYILLKKMVFFSS